MIGVMRPMLRCRRFLERVSIIVARGGTDPGSSRTGRALMIAIIALIASSAPLSAVPPFSGTIFLDPDIITESDPTTFRRLDDAGRGSRVMFDRRLDRYATFNAYLFNAYYSDGLKIEIQVNPEFGSQAAARAEAAKYAPVIGRLPVYLRVDVKTSWIHRGMEPFGGGNNNLLIHTGQAASYVADGVLEETLFHEAAHTSMDSRHATSAGWRAAQAADAEFISTYARDNPTREDIAESVLPWFAVRHRSDRISTELADTIRTTIPNRIAYFDRLKLDTFKIPVAPRLSVVKVRPVSAQAKHVRIRGSASANTVRVRIPGAKVRGTKRFTAKVSFPLRKQAIRISVIATSAEGLRTTKRVVARRLKR